MKKLINLLLIAAFIMAMFVSPITKVKAKTLKQVLEEVEAAEKALEDNKNKQDNTEDEMKQIQNDVYDILVEVDKTTKEIEKLNEEIEKLNLEIDEKVEQIKKLLNFVQKSDGNNAYLEYVFGAEDFTDLIYRTAIAEQLSNYNNKLIDEYTALVEKNTETKKSLEDKKQKLAEQRTSLEKKYSTLSSSLREIEDAEPTLEEEVKLQRETYKFYVDLGCELDDDIEICGRNLLPPTTVLYRPLEIGYFGTAWGSRCYYLRGNRVCDFHKGIDINKQGSAVPIYSAGAGKVAAVVKSPNAWSCGGQVVFISHNVRGKNYTTIYMHLRKIFVEPGDLVDKNTVIAYMGGSPGIETYDKCTTGQHLHFGVSEGAFVTWAKAKSTLVDPTTVMNFPKLHTTWTDRITQY